MWIMLTKKPPTQPSPPRLSIHWSVPWPHEKYAQKQQETCQRCGCRVQEGVSSSKSKKRGKHKLTLGCICPGGPTIVTEEDREIYTELGAEHNWSGARAIEYKGERIRVFPDEFSILNRVSGSNPTRSSNLTAYKKVIDGLIFPGPRFIELELPLGAEVGMKDVIYKDVDPECPEQLAAIEKMIGICERPLRAMGAQGERVALARSETVPAGTQLTIEIKLIDPALRWYVIEWLEYGKLRGLGQWRNSGKGRFTYEILEDLDPADRKTPRSKKEKDETGKSKTGGKKGKKGKKDEAEPAPAEVAE